MSTTTSEPRSDSPHVSIATGPETPVIDRHQYSCVRCRSRKVKCDRLVAGCTACRKVGIQCVYSGRHPRKAQHEQHKQQVRRLAAADSIPNNQYASTMGREGHSSNDEEEDDKLIPREIRDPSYASYNETKFDIGPLLPGRLFVAVKKRSSRFINSHKAVQLANLEEVIKAAMAVKDEEDTETPSGSPSKSEQVTVAMPSDKSRGIRLLNMPAVKQDLRSYHPPAKVQAILWHSYISNVDILVKILYKPTVTEIFEKLSEDLESVNSYTEALIFAIYYAAVTTLSTEDCEKLYGQSQPVLQQRYQHALEHALVQAEWMTSQNIMVLQAIILLIVCTLRTNLRSTWILIGIAMDIAQAMGLHRDGVYFALPVFVVEVRRRIWWALCVLDDRVSRECGLEAHIPTTMDTKMPTHLNDSDIVGSTIVSSNYDDHPPRSGFTEMTMSLVKIEKAEFILKLKAPPRRKAPLSNAEIEVLAREKIKRIESIYLQHIDRSTHLGRLCYIGTRLIMADIWKYAYDHCLYYIVPESAHVKEGLLRYNTEVLEITHQFPDSSDQYWWFFACKGPQWNAMAYLLTELRYHKEGVAVDRAWDVLDNVFKDLTKESETAEQRLTGVLLRRSRLWKALLKLCEQQRRFRTQRSQRPQAEGSDLHMQDDGSGSPEFDNVLEQIAAQNELALDDEFLGALPDCSEDLGWGMLDYFLQYWRQSGSDQQLESTEGHEHETTGGLNWWY